MNRGEVYWVNLDPTQGSETRKQRPCVLVGAAPINNARRTVVVVPLSTLAKRRLLSQIIQLKLRRIYPETRQV